MTHQDADLLAVRRLGDEPTPQSITRSWYRITQLEAAKSTMSRRRFLIPATAAGLILATVGVTALLRPASLGLAPAAVPETVTILHALADQAAAGTPTPVPPGHLIHVKVTGWAANFAPDGVTRQIAAQPADFLVKPEGLVRIDPVGIDSLPPPRIDKAGSADPAAGDPNALKPDGAQVDSGSDVGIQFPTTAWLAGLPAEPGQLLSRLREETAGHEEWSADHQLWDAMAELYYRGEILLSPAQRAAFLRAFTGIGELTARDTVVNGQRLIAIRHTQRDDAHEILFDPTTGRAVGRGTASLGADVTLIQAPGGPVLDPQITYAATWHQTYVKSS